MSQPAYREWPADPTLTDVACLWSGGPYTGAPAPGLVLPDACLDIIWDGTKLFVAGPDTGPVPVVRVPGTSVVGLRFRPGRAPASLGVAASELLDQHVPLTDLWGRAEGTRLADALAAADGLDAAAAVLVDAVRRRRECLSPASLVAADPLVDQLVSWLSRGPGSANVVARAGQLLGVGERRLHRRCTAAVGYGPKMLERVLRFRRAQALADAGALLADAAARAGYADQAHLSRECRRLSGLRPSDLFKTGAGVAA